MKEEVVNRVKRFMIDNRISCEETIYQCDWVVLNALEFIDDLFHIIKDELPRELEGEE